MKLIYLFLILFIIIGCEGQKRYTQKTQELGGVEIAEIPEVKLWSDGTKVTLYAWYGSAWKIEYTDGTVCYGKGEYLNCRWN